MYYSHFINEDTEICILGSFFKALSFQIPILVNIFASLLLTINIKEKQKQTSSKF